MQDHPMIAVQELCIYHNAEGRFIQSLEDFGLIQLTVIEEQPFLPASQLSELEKMIRLHYDLEVNIEGIEIIQHLLKQLEAAQEEICRLKSKIKFYGEARYEDE